MFLSPPDEAGTVYEFFSPFAHVEGLYEWCRIRSPTHGVFDTFILLKERPPVVYVGSDAGKRFMADRFPECQTFPAQLRIKEADDGRTVQGRIKTTQGPLKSGTMKLRAPGDTNPRNVPYGGKGEGIWGSRRFTCWGVDLVLDAAADGKLVWRDRPDTNLRTTPALVTLGSFGRIAPLSAAPTPAAPAPVAGSRQKRQSFN